METLFGDLIVFTKLYNEDEYFREQVEKINKCAVVVFFKYSLDCVYPWLPLHQNDFMPHFEIRCHGKDDMKNFGKACYWTETILTSEAKRKIDSREKTRQRNKEILNGNIKL